MHSKTKALAVTAGLAALVLSGCTAASPATDDSLVTVNVSVAAIAGTSTPMYLAVENGVFEDLGLDVQLDTATSGSLAVPTILADQYQFAMTSFDSFINAKSAGLPVELVSTVNKLVSSDTGYYGIIVPADSAATDMSGMSVLATTDAAKTALMDLLVTGLGGDYESMQVLQSPIGSIADAVAGGAADAGYLFQPFLGMALDAGDVKLLSSGTDEMTVPGAPSATFIATQEYLDNNEDVAQRFAQGVLEAYSYAAAHLDEVSEFTVVTGFVENPVPVGNLPAYASEPMPIEVVQQLLDVYSDLGYLEDAPNAEDIVWTAGGNFVE